MDAAMGSGLRVVGTDSSDLVRRFSRYKRTAVACVIEGNMAANFSATSVGEGAAKISSLRL